MHRFSPKIHLNANENHLMEHKYPKRSRSRTKSSTLDVRSLKTPSLEQNENIRFVRVRLVFMHIGDIDTLNEKYQAEIYYESRWDQIVCLNISKFNQDDQHKFLNENLPVRFEDPLILNWKPELFIENEIAKLGKEEIWFTIRKLSKGKNEAISPAYLHVDICEHRKLKGVFWEKLELNHFPADVQDLSVSITTKHHMDNCVLIPDDAHPSSINREAFFDQQEWNLYEHVGTETRETAEEYSFADEHTEIEEKTHSVLAVTCRAARRPGYYYWNGFSLIFLITLCSFCVFSIPPNLPQNRLQITSTLLLTSVTFRWVVNRSLPTISYLTTLDKYAIISIIILVVLCIWHSLISAIIFLNPEIALTTSSSSSISPTNIYVKVDRYVFIFIFFIYILIHILLIIWLIIVPYKRRRDMANLDRAYAIRKHTQLDTRRIKCKPSPSYELDCESIISQNKLTDFKEKDGIVILSNATSFLPIKEESSLTKQMEHTIDVNEQDDVFDDDTKSTSK